MNNPLDEADDTKTELPTETSSKIKNIILQNEQIVEKIPLFAENFTVTKKTEETQLILTKKWITTTTKIEIPIKYEEILIDGKEFDSYSENEITEIFSKIKHKITDVFLHEKGKDDADKEEGYHQSGDIEIKEYGEQSNMESHNQNNLIGKLIPFSLDGTKNDDISNIKKEENIIPLWGEEIIINKRMVKLGEIIIKKYETNEKQKIDIDIKTEKLTVKYPDNHKEEII
ncbi:MAG: DUF2382 domain-containing protein [Nitrosopumilus sp.]|nr:DUF2382 domain-containing protein [Nitrosopumilus sp.]